MQWPGAQGARDNLTNHLLPCNFAKFSPILKMLPLADSAINLSEFGYWQPHRTSNMLLHYLVMYRLFLTLMFHKVVWQHTQGVDNQPVNEF